MNISISECRCLHNFLLSLMERHSIPVGRGGPLENDGIWLSGITETDQDVETNTILGNNYVRRRAILAMHLRVSSIKGYRSHCV
jgi:hypothetical protein